MNAPSTAWRPRARGRKAQELTPAKLATARQLYDAKDKDAKDKMVAEIAGVVGVSRAALHRALEFSEGGEHACPG